MDWAQKPSIASYFLRTGMGSVPLTDQYKSPEVRLGITIKKDPGVSSLQNLLQLYSKISEDYRAKNNPKKAIAILRRALHEVDLRAAEAPAPGPDQKKRVHESEDVLLGKVKVRQQLCATFSRLGQHLDALNEAQKALEDLDQMWKDVCHTSDIQVDLDEISILDLFSNPLNVETMLRLYPLDWLEQAVSVTVQAKHCAALELEFATARSASEEEKAKAWQKIHSLHEEGSTLAKEILLPSHPTRRLAEATLSKARDRRSLMDRSTSSSINAFAMPDSDESPKGVVEEDGNKAEGEGDEGLLDGNDQEQILFKSSSSPTVSGRRRRRPVRRSPRNNLSRSSPSLGKNPFKDFFEDEWTLDTMRKHLLARDESCVREFHGELKRRNTQFREWLQSSDPDDLFEYRTIYNEAGKNMLRRQEKRKALAEGRPYAEDIDPKSQVKTVKGIKKNLVSSNMFLCRFAGVEQEDPNAPKHLAALTGAFKSKEPEKAHAGSRKHVVSYGAKVAGMGMKKTEPRTSKEANKLPGI